jgi:hypothetical protein
MRLQWHLLLAVLVGQSLPAQTAGDSTRLRQLWRANDSKPAILILGTFHFAGERVDLSRTPADLLPTMLTPKRQREIADLRARLVRWRPTRIAVEYPPRRQQTLDSLYRAYRRDSVTARELAGDPDELFQVAFPVARSLGIERLDAVDAAIPASWADSATYARYESEVIPGAAEWDARYDSLTALQDSLRARLPLRDFLAYLNSDITQAQSNGRWTVVTKLGTNREPVGADGFLARYFGRNMRIFSNIQRTIEQPTDRVLVLIGNTHGYLLRTIVRSSPEYRLHDASEVLGRRPLARTGRQRP